VSKQKRKKMQSKNHIYLNFPAPTPTMRLETRHLSIFCCTLVKHVKIQIYNYKDTWQILKSLYLSEYALNEGYFVLLCSIMRELYLWIFITFVAGVCVNTVLNDGIESKTEVGTLVKHIYWKDKILLYSRKLQVLN
jgi:hypothetical protein